MSLHGPRGQMAAIPVQEEQSRLALEALDRLLAGNTFSRADIFQNMTGGRDRIWESRFFGRLVREGAAHESGSGTKARIYTIADHGIAMRFKGLLLEEDITIREKGHGHVFAMTLELRSLLDGLLLGDGHISKPISGGLSCCFQIDQREDRVSWLEDIQSTFENLGVQSSLTNRSAQNRVLRNGKILNGRPSNLLRTICYRNLIEQRMRWYPHGKKVVPQDVNLGNPVTLAQWYMGDGGIICRTGGLSLSTCCFSADEVKWLSMELYRKHGIESSRSRCGRYPMISLYGRHAMAFVRIVSPHIVPCFKYKLLLEWTAPKCVDCGQIIDNRTGHAKYCDDCCTNSAWKVRVAHGLMRHSVELA